MKHSKRKFVELEGLDTKMLNDEIIEYAYSNITGYMTGLSKLVSHKYGLVRAAMSISGIEAYQGLGPSGQYWQLIEIKGKSGSCSLNGYVGGPDFK